MEWSPLAYGVLVPVIASGMPFFESEAVFVLVQSFAQ